MSDRMKRFLEAVAKDKAVRERTAKAETTEELAAIAKELGFELAPEEFEQMEIASVREEEFTAVTGGSTGTCYVGLFEREIRPKN